MTKKRPLVIVTRRLPDVIETRMMELFDCRLNEDDAPINQAGLVQAVHRGLDPALQGRVPEKLGVPPALGAAEEL